VCIAVSVVCEPPIVVLDEPTTGLDVVTQAKIIEELIRLRREHQISMIYIAHDLAVVAQVADRIAVMYAGRVIEEGPAEKILRAPRHPYTSGLLASVPDHLRPRVLEPMAGVSVAVGERPRGCAFAPRCPLCVDECKRAVPELTAISEDHLSRCRRAEIVTAPVLAPLALEHRQMLTEKVLTVSHLRAEHRGRGHAVVAARDISFAVAHGECVGLVGESGSGKTTIARAIAGLHPPTSGEIRLHDTPLAPHARSRTRDQRRSVQIIFQNPGDALNPRHMVRDAIARPARLLRGLGRTEANAEVERLLELVRLPQRVAGRYPSELSGGERQRIGIARALASGPELIICDEVTSALDVSVQAAVLKLLGDLKAELGLALLFITHDLGVVATIADSLLVLERGDVCEQGPVQSVFDSPQHPYTQGLMAAAPSITAALEDRDHPQGRPPTDPRVGAGPVPSRVPGQTT
jgi:peptide/nickel transport system ATP-binding protein